MTGWTLLVVVVPVFYLLSAPPIFIKARIEGGTRGEPDWVTAYSRPYFWVCNNTPLGQPLGEYEGWCWEWLIPK